MLLCFLGSPNSVLRLTSYSYSDIDKISGMFRPLFFVFLRPLRFFSLAFLVLLFAFTLTSTPTFSTSYVEESAECLLGFEYFKDFRLRFGVQYDF